MVGYVARRLLAVVPVLGMVAIFVFLLGNLVTILAPSLPLYLAGRALSGIGAGLFSPLAVATGYST